MKIMNVLLLALALAGTAKAADLDQIKSAIASQLRDPSSARFRDVRVSKRTHAICGLVNAKNGFGGYTGFTRFVVTREDGRLVLDGQGGFFHAWQACETAAEAAADKAIEDGIAKEFERPTCTRDHTSDCDCDRSAPAGAPESCT